MRIKKNLENSCSNLSYEPNSETKTYYYFLYSVSFQGMGGCGAP